MLTEEGLHGALWATYGNTLVSSRDGGEFPGCFWQGDEADACLKHSQAFEWMSTPGPYVCGDVCWL